MGLVLLSVNLFTGGVVHAAHQIPTDPSGFVGITGRGWVGEGIWNYTASVENEELIAAPASWELDGRGRDTSLSMNYWIDSSGNLIIDFELAGFPSLQEQNLSVLLSTDDHGVIATEGLLPLLIGEGQAMIKAADIKELVEKNYDDVDPVIYVYSTYEEEWESMVMDYRLPLKKLLN